MSTSQRHALRDLLQRVDEVRGLAGRSDAQPAVDPDDTDTVVRTMGELVEELERSHRRLIETNVQLVSLREVASRMVTSLDDRETTRIVSRYLARAFSFEHAFLLLLQGETGKLQGTWTCAWNDRDTTHWVELPVVGDRGVLARSLWLNRTVLLRDPERHAPLNLADGHPLQENIVDLGSFACAPLQRSPSLLPAGETHELCGARCILGDAAVMVPPPGSGAETWSHDREERERHCLQCDLLPLLGVIGIARPRDAMPLTPADVTLLESIALSVAPMIENARLYQDLRRSERFRLHVLDSMAAALVAVNMKGEILTFNRAAEDLLGATETEVKGQHFGALFGNDGEALIQAALEQGREVLREEAVLRARDGSPLAVSLTTSLLRNERRNVYGAIATFMDLTPLKRAEERARSQDRLAALGRFTSSVAHEIRNPLTGIAAGVQYLARALEDQVPQRENLDFILSEIRRLDGIVQDLFDITHPRALHLRPGPLDETVRRALQSLEPLLAERRVRVTVRVAPSTPTVSFDADQIQQVFINLIKNGAEASPAGAELRVAVAAIAARSRGTRSTVWPGVAAEVHDAGSGIAPEDLKRLFEPFFTTKPGGTGLGLYICHDIVKRHGGALTVHSVPGRGTTFRVELPLEPNGGTS